MSLKKHLELNFMEIGLKKYLKHFFLCFTSEGFHKQELQIKSKYTDIVQQNVARSVIFMVDGKTVHGGLGDRLKGICTVYELCKRNNVTFKINFTYPFDLSKYLIPNLYDWTLNETSICYNSRLSKPIFLNTHQLLRCYHKLYFKFSLICCQQLHVYGNTDLFMNNFHNNFHELFKPSKKLQNSIIQIQKQINSSYDSVVFRFQQLLGDFKERNYKILDDIQKEELIKKCRSLIEKLHSEQTENKKILVTSDSVTFLHSVMSLDYVYVIPGKVVHMDYTSDADYDTYEKSFLDLMVLSKSTTIYLAYTDDMYKSGFAKVAALIGNCKYKEIEF